MEAIGFVTSFKTLHAPGTTLASEPECRIPPGVHPAGVVCLGTQAQDDQGRRGGAHHDRVRALSAKS